MSLNVILASTPCGIIGVDGDLPWKLRSDLIHFKSLTEGHPIVMGRKTYESLPGVLPNRLHIVVTSNPESVNSKGNTIIVPTIGYAIQLAEMHSGPSGDYFVVGGASLYQPILDCIKRSKESSAVPGIGNVYWTRVDAKASDFDGEITKIDISVLEEDLDLHLRGNIDDTFLNVKHVDVNRDQFNQYDFKIVKFTEKKV
ncbi:MAG: hypothetical protein CL582_17820 [Alteromonadaceae bacterium]|nr:hypothetical protein [Alteromonadaceae bacterium]